MPGDGDAIALALALDRSRPTPVVRWYQCMGSVQRPGILVGSTVSDARVGPLHPTPGSSDRGGGNVDLICLCAKRPPRGGGDTTRIGVVRSSPQERMLGTTPTERRWTLTDSPRHPADDDIRPDLVEFVIVVVPDMAALADVVPALAQLVRTGIASLLDLVVLGKDPDGTVQVLELDMVESLTGLRAVEGQIRPMLSDHDIELAALAIEPGTAGLVLVTEGRWALPLSLAVERAGGQIVAGERIPAARVQRRLGEGAAGSGDKG